MESDADDATKARLLNSVRRLTLTHLSDLAEKRVRIDGWVSPTYHPRSGHPDDAHLGAEL